MDLPDAKKLLEPKLSRVSVLLSIYALSSFETDNSLAQDLWQFLEFYRPGMCFVLLCCRLPPMLLRNARTKNVGKYESCMVFRVYSSSIPRGQRAHAESLRSKMMSRSRLVP